MPGPLSGLRIIEIAGIGPAPFCAMMLADHGAEVIRVDRAGGAQSHIKRDRSADISLRSRKSIVLNLKNPEGIAILRDLAKTSAALIEGFRPGVMERLGIGPEVLLQDNPELVYGRMTGWGQSGPYAQAAGHDINYIALAGNLHGYGRAGGKPTPPLNAVGDFGGGGMMLAFGIMAAIFAARNGAGGQVVDCAMTDGAAVLATMTWTLWAQGLWADERGVNLLDTGAHFYDTYETADHKWISIGAIEPQFYAELLRLTGLQTDPAFAGQMDKSRWPLLRERLTAVFMKKTRDEWCALMERTDACFAPVLSLSEAPTHPHNVARNIFSEIDGIVQPNAAPRYSVTKNAAPLPVPPPGAHTAALLAELGYEAADIERRRAAGAFSA